MGYYDNPLLYTQELREQIRSSLTSLLGLTYTVIETETVGHPFLLGNEFISVIDMDGEPRYTYPFNRSIIYNGHIKTKIATSKPAEQTSMYAYEGADSEPQAIKKTYARLDRDEQLLDVYMTKTNDIESTVQVKDRVSGNNIEIDNAGAYTLEHFVLLGDDTGVTGNVVVTIANGSDTTSEDYQSKSVTIPLGSITLYEGDSIRYINGIWYKYQTLDYETGDVLEEPILTEIVLTDTINALNEMLFL